MATYKYTTTLRIQEEIYEKLRHVSSCEHRSINSQMEYFILKGIEQYEKGNGVISLFGKE